MSCFFKQQFCRVLWLLGSFYLCWLSPTSEARGQILPDRTLPNNTVVIPNGNTSVIEQGTRVGSNLFHSFQEFSVPIGGEAFFNNAIDIQNIILGTLTGGDVTIRASESVDLLNASSIYNDINPGASANAGNLTIETRRLRLEEGSQVSASTLGQTAKGDNRAALGLAGVAVRSGARSTLATLWSVQDKSTAQLMAEFYRLLTQPGVTKAEALRYSQLSLLNSPQYKHPYYWSPFVLVGNWL